MYCWRCSQRRTVVVLQCGDIGKGRGCERDGRSQPSSPNPKSRRAQRRWPNTLTWKCLDVAVAAVMRRLIVSILSREMSPELPQILTCILQCVVKSIRWAFKSVGRHNTKSIISSHWETVRHLTKRLHFRPGIVAGSGSAHSECISQQGYRSLRLIPDLRTDWEYGRCSRIR